jgi:iron complex transport system ATP-binding protein
MLEVTDLKIQLGGSFHVSVPHWRAGEGSLHAVLGANGAGKTTLLRALSSELPSGNSARLHGRVISGWPALERARHLGVLPQSSQLSFGFSGAEVVALGLTPLSLDSRGARSAVRRAMQQTDCDHLANKGYPQLSGGERQRVQLARVLLQLSQAERPPLLLLDEPTSAQDLGHQHGMLSLAQELCGKGFCVVAILHDLNLALRYADHCLLLDRGSLVRQGTPTEVIDGDSVQRYWRYAATVLQTADGTRVIA